MKKKYFIFVFFLLLAAGTVQAQDGKSALTNIEGLNFYPNPVSNGKIYITTAKQSLEKEVTIFDVLGKKVLNTTLTTKELNVSSLAPGVYIIKIREAEATATRKLIVK